MKTTLRPQKSEKGAYVLGQEMIDSIVRSKLRESL